MRFLILLPLVLLSQDAGVKIGNYIKPSVGVYYNSIIKNKWSYTILYDREFNRNLKSYKSVNLYSKSKGFCPAKVIGKTLNLKSTVKDIDRVELNLNYICCQIGSTELDLVSGIGYSFSKNIYKNDRFYPVGLRLTVAHSQGYMAYLSYKVILEEGLNQKDTVGSFMIGHTF